MKNIKFNYFKIIPLFILAFAILFSCERELSDDVEFAKYSNKGDIFIDGFTGGLDYFPYLGSYAEAFSVDTETKYKGSSAMRFDIPNAGDPAGAYAGAIFRLSSPRDLSDFDALTFWAKATESATINDIGFGQDFGENKFQSEISGALRLTTYWKKYIIPIPDPSKLIAETGMMWYAEGPEENGDGYSFWIDELQFEKLGNIGQPRPAIMDGENVVVVSFEGVNIELTGLTQTFNLGSGLDQTVKVAPSYFTFSSTNVDVARVSENGIVNVVGKGSATITALLGGVKAVGSLTVEVGGSFEFAPTPTRSPSDVISIFSDVYINVPVDFFNGYWEPYQTTLSSELVINGDHILSYTDFNFVGNQFANPTVNATEKSNLHINMYIPGTIPANLDFLITIKDFGADQVDGGGDDTFQQVFFNGSDFVADTWSTLEIPITLPVRNHIGLIIYENINGSSLTNFYLDNIYFYKQ